MLQKYWYDTRVRAGVVQVALLLLFFGGLGWLGINTRDNLTRQGMNIDFGFFHQASRFPISETLVSYSPADTFGRAFLVGLLNTLMVASIVICLSTVLGFLLMLARRSKHPLVSGVAQAYIEIIRNTPLIVHLMFWYMVVITTLPNVRNALEPLPFVFLSVRGIFAPSIFISGTAQSLPWASAVALLLIITAVMLRSLRRRTDRVPAWISRPQLIIVAVAIFGAFWILDGLTLSADLPQLRGLNYRGGISLTPEFSALVVALVSYKVAFIAEIYRGGIDAVSRGQWEAGRAVGLKDRDTLRLVVLPQALRIIVPPMASMYLTAVKNTTIALAIGYPDLSAVVSTAINQSGRALEGFGVMIAVYLCISLAVASFMNWYNRRVSLVVAK
ncbi:amino acid ABC transporter permease [Pararhizobium sp. DWP1-1-3]|uniref:amino acid ABC transporter permease n=1 Tax=Pararhizobium sp. DWP1-1-3 TaxID=2804652 RepID=UPI003CF1B1EB